MRGLAHYSTHHREHPFRNVLIFCPQAVINGVDVKESVRFAMELARGAQNEIDSAEDKNIKELRSWLFPDDDLDLADNKST